MRERITTGSDGVAVYTTIDGDVVDLIAFVYYGQHDRHTEAILEANPGLAEMGEVLSAGVRIRLPRVAAQETPKPFRQLWN